MTELEVEFGDGARPLLDRPRVLRRAGVPAGLDALWRRYGRLPWPRLVEPALRLARAGVELPPAHASCLAMLEPVMTMRRGRADLLAGRHAARRGRPARPAGARRGARGASPPRAPRTVYSGTLADALLGLMEERGGLVTRADLEAYEARLDARRSRPSAPATGSSRAAALRRRGDARRGCRRCAGSPSGARADLVAALEAPDGDGHTTNLVDRRRGRARLRAHDQPRPRLGRLRPGLRPAPEQHARRDRPRSAAPHGPGDRMQSMMAPTLALDARRPRARARLRGRDAAPHRARRRR